MKKITVFLFLLFQITIFSAYKSLSNIKTLKFNVTEKTIINSKRRELRYSVDFELPSKIRKEVNFPNLNKGELYIYDYTQNKKMVYLPIFNERKESIIDNEENRVILAIERIIEAEKKDKKFKENLENKVKQSLKIDNTISIEIIDYIEESGRIFPRNISIKDSGVDVGEITISDLKIDLPLESEIFKFNINKE